MLGVTALVAFMAFLDVTIVNVAFPAIARGFRGTSLAELSWVLNAYNIVFAALLVPAGRVADLLGRKRMLIAGLTLFTVGSAVGAVAPSVGALIAARAAQGAGAGIGAPASLALLLSAFPFEKRALAVGLWSASGALASGIGPSLGGFLTHAGGWRWIFLVNLPIGVACILLSARLLVESRDPARTGFPDPVGIVLVGASMALLALGIVQGHQWGWTSARVLGSLAGGVLLAVAFVLRSSRHRNPVVELGLLRERVFAAANVGTVLFASAFYGLLLCNVLFLTQVWHYSIIKAGLALSPSPLMAGFVAGPAGRLADARGHRRVIVPGIAIYVVGVLMFALRAGTHADFLGVWLPAAICTGVGTGLAFPTLAAAAVSALPASRFATGSAIQSATRQLGAVLGAAIIVAILGSPSPANALDAFDHGWTFVIISALAAGPACVLLRTAKHGKEADDAAPPAEAHAEVRAAV